MKQITDDDIMQWDKLVKLVISKHFYANDILEEEDLYTIGLTGVWKALKSYDENIDKGNGKVKLKNYIFRIVYNEIGTAISNNNRKGRKEFREITQTLEKPIGKNNDCKIEDIIPCKYAEELSFKTYLGEIAEKHLEYIDEFSKNIVLLKTKGFTVRNISTKLGISRTTVSNKYRRAIEQMNYKSPYKNFQEIIN